MFDILNCRLGRSWNGILGGFDGGIKRDCCKIGEDGGSGLGSGGGGGDGSGEG